MNRYNVILSHMDRTQATRNGFYRHIGMTAVGDVGKIGNILAVEGQAYEGISHNISFALQNQYKDLKKHAPMAGAGVPYVEELPDILRSCSWIIPDKSVLSVPQDVRNSTSPMDI